MALTRCSSLSTPGFLSGTDACRGSGGDCAAFIEDGKLRYSIVFTLMTVGIMFAHCLCGYWANLYFLVSSVHNQTVTNNEIMFCTPWVYVTMENVVHLPALSRYPQQRM